MISLLFPFLIAFAIANRVFANIFYAVIALLGVYILLRRQEFHSVFILWASVLAFYFLLTIFVGFPVLSDFVLEIRPMFVLPAGMAMQFIAIKYYNKFSYTIFLVFLLFVGACLAVLSGFTFRFTGVSAFPVLGLIWVPTYSTVLYFTMLSGIVRNPIVLGFSTFLLFLSAVNSVVFSAIALILYILLRKVVASLSSAKINVIFIFLPILLVGLGFVFVLIYSARRTIDFTALDYDDLLLLVDRLAFYDTYFQTYLSGFSLSTLAEMIVGHGVGVSVLPWVLSLPPEFRGMNLLWYSSIGSTSLLFQIDFLRLGFSFGAFGLVFLVYSVLYPLRISVSSNLSGNLLPPQRLNWIPLSIFVMSTLTVAMSTTGIFIGFAYVSSCIVADHRRLIASTVA